MNLCPLPTDSLINVSTPLKLLNINSFFLNATPIPRPRPWDISGLDPVSQLHLFFFFFNILFIYLFWLLRVLVVAHGLFSCGMQTPYLRHVDSVVACMQDLVP